MVSCPSAQEENTCTQLLIFKKTKEFQKHLYRNTLYFGMQRLTNTIFPLFLFVMNRPPPIPLSRIHISSKRELQCSVSFHDHNPSWLFFAAPTGAVQSFGMQDAIRHIENHILSQQRQGK